MRARFRVFQTIRRQQRVPPNCKFEKSIDRFPPCSKMAGKMRAEKIAAGMWRSQRARREGAFHRVNASMGKRRGK